MSRKILQLDVREDIRNGREPFGRIMAAAQQLGPADGLKLLAPFEPRPLYTFLGNLGLSPSARELPDGSWEILFERPGGAEPATGTPEPIAQSKGSRTRRTVIQCDARGLEPPQPMVKILEAVASLAPEAELHARTDRRPMHLFPQLESRGFHSEYTEQPDGSFITVIRHA